MTAILDSTTERPVRKSIAVKAGVEEAFRIFTEDFDSWWPRSHHIGKSPMKRAVVECRQGGRCYTVQEDGSDCDWGTVLAWEPPRRVVLAWQITHQWGYEPDLARSSEVEVRFTPAANGTTRVDLEHRYFHRHGAGGVAIRTAVDSPNGWGDLLVLFARRAGMTG
ncbi:MAG TPA: SRPBCC family protein [Gemmatimonadaceae bacterium]|nr:SRPBCC family protein [Gemmatimonadaceae bacterium]